MKKGTVKTLGAILGVVLVIIVGGLLGAALVTFVIGLFFTFPLTLINVLKVWLALFVIRLVLMGIK